LGQRHPGCALWSALGKGEANRSSSGKSFSKKRVDKGVHVQLQGNLKGSTIFLKKSYARYAARQYLVAKKGGIGKLDIIDSSNWKKDARAKQHKNRKRETDLPVKGNLPHPAKISRGNFRYPVLHSGGGKGGGGGPPRQKGRKKNPYRRRRKG